MKVGLGLGSNLGDRLLNLQQAKRYLLSLSREGWHLASPLYETDPIDCAPDSPKFLNAVLEIEFEGAPKTLLKKIQAYETAHVRDRSTGRNAPRAILLACCCAAAIRCGWKHISGAPGRRARFSSARASVKEASG